VAWGDWSLLNERFPDTLEHLAAEMTSRGYTPGLWLAPFAADKHSQLAQDHPDWILRKGAGKGAAPVNSGYVVTP
jgi:alpha-galactosidase